MRLKKLSLTLNLCPFILPSNLMSLGDSQQNSNVFTQVMTILVQVSLVLKLAETILQLLKKGLNIKVGINTNSNT